MVMHNIRGETIIKRTSFFFILLTGIKDPLAVCCQYLKVPSFSGRKTVVRPCCDHLPTGILVRLFLNTTRPTGLKNLQNGTRKTLGVLLLITCTFTR